MRSPLHAHVPRWARPALLACALMVASPAQAQDTAGGPGHTLRSLLMQMLAADPQVRLSAIQADIALQRQQQARSRLGPNLFVESQYGRGNEIEFGQALRRHTDRADAGLRWNLYNGGIDRAERNATELEAQAGSQEWRRAREEAADRLIGPYADLLKAQHLLPLAAARLASVQGLSRQVREQVVAGKLSEADGAQADASVLDAQLSLEQLQLDADSARTRLLALAGVAVDTVLPIDLPPAAALAPANEGTTGAVAAALHRAEAAAQRVTSELNLALPRIDLEWRKQLSDRTLPQLSTVVQHEWRLTARWDFPVMGENAARRRETQLRADAAQADAQRLAKAVAIDRQALPARIAHAERALAQLDQQIGQQQTLIRAGQAQFEAGRRTLAQLITLHDALFNVRLRQADMAQRLLTDRLKALALQGQLLGALGLAT